MSQKAMDTQMEIGSCYAMLTYLARNGKTIVEKISGATIVDVETNAELRASDASVFTLEFPPHIRANLEELNWWKSHGSTPVPIKPSRDATLNWKLPETLGEGLAGIIGLNEVDA